MHIPARTALLLGAVTIASPGALPSPVLAQAQPAAAPARPWMDAQLAPERRAALLLAQMTQDEKLTMVFGYFGSVFAPQNYTAPAGALKGSAGYVPGIPRLGIPAQFETDAGIGVATQGDAKVKRERTALPSGIATAATWNPELAQQGGAMIGAEARASGFNVMLAGGVNLLREPRNGRNFEYAGEDPWLAGTMVGAQIAGIQSNHIVSTVKHYAINDQETDRDTGNSIIDEAAMRTSDLLAFAFAIERGRPASVMCSYNRINGIHACEHPFLLTRLLREEWGWQGYVMSDWGGTHSTVAAANAGLDQESGYPFDKEPYFGAPLKAAIADGSVSPARLDQMVGRILWALFDTGALDHPVKQAPIDFAAHAAISRADAEEGLVLLQNARALLPLSPAVTSIAIIGGHADKGVLAGGGSSLVYPRGGNAVPGIAPEHWPGPVMYYPSAPLEQIRKLAPKAQIRFVDGSDRAAAGAIAKQSEVAIVFATQWAGESFDVPLTLADEQDQLIDAVARANARTVVVLETGGPVLTPWRMRVAAILAAWYPGTDGGTAIANLLFGKAAPSGHLPATFPADLDQLTDRNMPHKDDVRYEEGAAVGYKWYDLKGYVPAFPFGHGLTYTSFDHAGFTAGMKDGRVTIGYRVTNTGNRAGADVGQVYVGPVDTVSAGWEAPKRLGAFEKVSLRPGESRAVTLTIDPRLLATWDGARHRWRIAGGRYRVMLARSATDIVSTTTVTVPAATLPGGPLS